MRLQKTDGDQLNEQHHHSKNRRNPDRQEALLEFEQTLLAFDFMISEANDPFTREASRNNFLAIQIILATGGLEKLLKRT